MSLGKFVTTGNELSHFEQAAGQLRLFAAP
jgi:hypothetical protein